MSFRQLDLLDGEAVPLLQLGEVFLGWDGLPGHDGGEARVHHLLAREAELLVADHDRGRGLLILKVTT